MKAHGIESDLLCLLLPQQTKQTQPQTEKSESIVHTVV